MFLGSYLLAAVVFAFNFIQICSQSTQNCEKTMSCFLHPPKCQDKECTIIHKWIARDSVTDFEIAAKLVNFPDRWLAIGFSYDDTMGDDSVVICKSTGTVESFYNTNYSPAPIDPYNINIGLTNVNVRQNDGWLICSFTRLNQISGLKKFFDLNNNYFVLAAYGNINSTTGRIRKHSFTVVSDKAVDFRQMLTTTQSTSTSTVLPVVYNSDFLSSTDCMVKYGCFLSPANCKDNECTFIYKWNDNGASTDFVIAAKTNELVNKWLAIGFSKDDLMGDDSVVLCKSDGTTGNYYNKGKSRPSLLDSSNPNIGISNAQVTQNNGWLICRFTRQKKYMPNMDQYFDLNNNFFILAALGDVNPSTGLISKHTTRVASPKAVNFQSKEILGGSINLAKYKAHGCLMVIAWILFASTGIIIARYYKFLFPGKNFLGVQFWFTVHRPVMVMVPVISLVAFMVILSQLNWKWVSSDNKLEFAHSIFGIVAIAFAFIQPFIALLRCDKDHKYRFIFNYVHRTIGISSLIFAIVAMFLGSKIEIMFLHSNGWGLLIGWTLWLGIFVIASEVLAFKSNQTMKTIDSVNDQSTDLKFANLARSTLIILHVVVALSFTIALLVIIGSANPN